MISKGDSDATSKTGSVVSELDSGKDSFLAFTRVLMLKTSDVNLIYRILAPTTYIFFASAIPVITFGEQLERDTGTSRMTLLLPYPYLLSLILV